MTRAGRVTSLRTFVVAVSPGINWVFVRLDTDRGLHGWGEATLEGKDLSVLAALRELGRTVVGSDADEIERAWYAWRRGAPWRGVALYTAMSALETALWDLKGKRLEVPLIDLLGGPVRRAVPAYTWLPLGTPGEVHAAAQLACETYGFTRFKSDPFTSFHSITKAELQSATEQLQAVAQAVPGARVALEGHTRFTSVAARRIAQQLVSLDLIFFEDPVDMDDLDGLRRLRQTSPVPLSAGEKSCTRWGIWPLLREGLVDYIHPDLCHVGGVSELRRVSAVAETVGVPVIPHNPNGPIAMAATLAVAMTTPNVVLVESVHTRFALMQVLAPGSFTVVGGELTAVQAPGLGVDLDLDVLAAHEGEPADFPIPPDAAFPNAP